MSSGTNNRANGNQKQKPRGTLIIIGGHEEKQGDQLILREVVDRIGKGRLVITTVASQEPQALLEEYTDVFNKLGIEHIDCVDIRTREDAMRPENAKKVEEAAGVFFSGGDQLRITSQIGDSITFRAVQTLYQEGGVIAGTSAGAAAMSETMLTIGNNGHSVRVVDLHMATGLGLLPNVVIDSHFAERGRIGRLIGAVGQNPKSVGLGIDENTAIVVTPDQCFRVVGEGAVYIIDGSTITQTNLAEGAIDQILTAHNVRLHLLGTGDQFDLTTREPLVPERKQDKQEKK